MTIHSIPFNCILLIGKPIYFVFKLVLVFIVFHDCEQSSTQFDSILTQWLQSPAHRRRMVAAFLIKNAESSNPKRIGICLCLYRNEKKNNKHVFYQRNAIDCNCNRPMNLPIYLKKKLFRFAFIILKAFIVVVLLTIRFWFPIIPVKQPVRFLIELCKIKYVPNRLDENSEE